MNRLFFTLIAVCALLAPAWVHTQENPQAGSPDNNLVVMAKHVRKDGQAYYELQATGVVRATPQLTWKVLTTYDEMHKYVPNLAAAKLVSRTDQESVIEQKWVKRILFFPHTVNLVVRATERPMSGIDITLVSGEMKQYSAHWELTPIGINGVNGTRITYYGKIEPDSYMPAFFGTSVMRSDLKEMMQAVLAEIDK